MKHRKCTERIKSRHNAERYIVTHLAQTVDKLIAFFQTILEMKDENRQNVHLRKYILASKPYLAYTWEIIDRYHIVLKHFPVLGVRRSRRFGSLAIYE